MLRPGYLADLTLLDGDITTTPIGDSDKLQVRLTVCGGQITYHKPDAAI